MISLLCSLYCSGSLEDTRALPVRVLSAPSSTPKVSRSARPLHECSPDSASCWESVSICSESAKCNIYAKVGLVEEPHWGKREREWKREGKVGHKEMWTLIGSQPSMSSPQLRLADGCPEKALSERSWRDEGNAVMVGVQHSKEPWVWRF